MRCLSRRACLLLRARTAARRLDDLLQANSASSTPRSNAALLTAAADSRAARYAAADGQEQREGRREFADGDGDGDGSGFIDERLQSVDMGPDEGLLLDRGDD